jgi:hypothetical protein
MLKSGRRSVQRTRCDSAKLACRIGSTERGFAVLNYDFGGKGFYKYSEKRQWQPMPHYIEQDEATAITANIANQMGKIRFGEVMSQMHGERYISGREHVTHGVGANDGNANVSPATRVHVDANHLDSELAANLVSNLPRSAPDVEYAGDRERISSNGANH